MEYSDRSALVFAPEQHGPDDGLLQIREIRNLPFKANLVTLSACDTGVGPVGEEGVANIVNVFVEAGAQTVVSTLWELARDRRFKTVGLLGIGGLDPPVDQEGNPDDGKERFVEPDHRDLLVAEVLMYACPGES
jgi:hypothetical protein